MTYKATLRRSASNMHEETINLEFTDMDLEGVLTAVEAVMLHAESDVSVYIRRMEE